jgi:membrane peptidoglycan carboxypeptidase
VALAALRDRYGSSILARTGLSVRTTLDWGLQQQAELAVRLAIAPGHGPTDSELVAIDPRTGELLAYAQATQAADASNLGTIPHNGTNAFRVFAYAAAIASRRYTMVTPLDDTPLTVDPAGPSGGRYMVQDFDLHSHGTCALRDCIGNGYNVPAVDLELGAGVAPVVVTARRLGASPLTFLAPPGSDALGDGPLDSYGLSLTLGGYPVTPLAFTAGLAALADSGAAHAPNPLLRVTPARGAALAQPRSKSTTALDPGSAFIVSETLADAANRSAPFGSGPALAFAGRHVAAVTGDVEDSIDALAGGYTPSLAATLWTGKPQLPGAFGSSHGLLDAAPPWHRFMQAALDQLGKGDEWYQPPAGVTTATVDGRPAWFLSGTSPATPAPALPANVVRGLS